MSPHAQCTCLQPQITSTAHKLHYTVHVPVCLDTPVLTLLIPDIQSPISLSLTLTCHPWVHCCGFEGTCGDLGHVDMTDV